MKRLIQGITLTEEALRLIEGREEEFSPDDELEPGMTQLGVLEDEQLRKLSLAITAEKKRLRGEAEALRDESDSLTIKGAKELSVRLAAEAAKVDEVYNLFWTLVKDTLPADTSLSEYSAVGIAKGWVIYGIKTRYSEILSQLFGGQVEIIRL